jgi:hypothetical protein
MNSFTKNERSDDRIMADAILGAVAEGDGHMFTPAEIDWALEVTGDIHVAQKSMLREN